MPGHTLIFLQPFGIALVAVVGPLLAVETEIAAPIVVDTAVGVGTIGGVFDNDPLVKTTRHIARGKMHLADIDAAVAAVGQILYPIAVPGPLVKAIGPCIVGVHTGESGRPRSHASGPRTKGLAERSTRLGQTVHMRGDHMIAIPGANGIKALLVGHNKNDMGSLVGHGSSRKG